MKRLNLLILVLLLTLSFAACSIPKNTAQIAATTLPVYDLTQRICADTPIQVSQVISQEISCLHDYTLQLGQMQAIESAQVLVISGAGLEEGLLPEGIRDKVLDASQGIELLCGTDAHDHDHDHGHHHDSDPHIWLSPANAKMMAENIYSELCRIYPQHADAFTDNFSALADEFDKLERYAQEELADLSCRKLVTFHDGFAYMAQAWQLELLHSVEEESGSEASAEELIQLCRLVQENDLPAIFTEKSGSISAAAIVAAETGVSSFCLDMAMSGEGYFEAMYHNIRTLKEALG